MAHEDSDRDSRADMDPLASFDVDAGTHYVWATRVRGAGEGRATACG